MPDDPRLAVTDPARDPRDALDVLDPDGPLRRPRPGHPLVDRVGERVAPWVAWFGLRRLVATAVTVVVVVAAGWWLLRAPAPPTEAGLPYASTTTTSAAPGPPAPTTTAALAPVSTSPTVLVVHVAGAVAAPGVYELPAGARAGDAVSAAGGPAGGAELDALNLAAPLQDGERVYVPVEGEAVPPPLPSAGGDGASTPTAPTGPIDLNRATAEELDALPGIGPSTALAIVAHREANGPFATVDDLEQVRGIGPAKLEAIRPLVTL